MKYYIWIDKEDDDMMNVMAYYEYVELWDHVKGMMIQGWIRITCVPYYDMTMMWLSHYMKGCSERKFSCNT